MERFKEVFGGNREETRPISGNKYSLQMEGEKDICTTMYFNNKEKSIFII